MEYKLYTLDNKFIKGTNKFPNNFTGILEYMDGTKKWLRNGFLHRIDGPAVEYYTGGFDWWINGEYSSKEECELLHSIMKLKKLI